MSLYGGQVKDVICLADLFFHAFVLDGAGRSARHQGRRLQEFAQVVVKRQSFEPHVGMRREGTERGKRIRVSGKHISRNHGAEIAWRILVLVVKGLALFLSCLPLISVSANSTKIEKGSECYPINAEKHNTTEFK